jgi:PTS system cellobiose-specific IIA component
MEALYEAKAGNFDSAHAKMQEANEAFHQAHRYQTDLIQAEAGGEKFDLPIILIHAQDHLMNALTVKDLANEFIDLYEKLSTTTKGELK